MKSTLRKMFSFAENKADLNENVELKRSDLGKIHKAALEGDLVKINELLTMRNTDIDKLDKKQRTALHIACLNGQDKVVSFLIQKQACLDLRDDTGNTALMTAVQKNNLACVNILLKNQADPNLQDSEGQTALHLATKTNNVSVARLLLNYRADLNAQTKRGYTPLSFAICYDFVDMTQFLVEAGADVNLSNIYKETPLMFAAKYGNYELLKLLLEHRAITTLVDYRGWSAKDHASDQNHQACANLISNQAAHRRDGASAQDQGKKDQSRHVEEQDEEEDTEEEEPKDQDEEEDTEEEEPKDQDEEDDTEEEEPKDQNKEKYWSNSSWEFTDTPETSMSHSHVAAQLPNEEESPMNKRDRANEQRRELLEDLDLATDNISFASWDTDTELPDSGKKIEKPILNKHGQKSDDSLSCWDTDTELSRDDDQMKEDNKIPPAGKDKDVNVDSGKKNEKPHLNKHCGSYGQKSDSLSSWNTESEHSPKQPTLPIEKVNKSAKVHEQERDKNQPSPTKALPKNTALYNAIKDSLKTGTNQLQRQKKLKKIHRRPKMHNSSDSEANQLLEENAALRKRLVEAHREIRTKSDSLAKVESNLTKQLTTQKSELDVMRNCLESEKQSREGLEKQVEQLNGVIQDLRLREEKKGRLTAESENRSEEVSCLTQKVSKAEARVQHMERKLQRSTQKLTEKDHQMELLQKEKDETTEKVKKLETLLQTQKELAKAQQEATQEQLVQAQTEAALLRKQLQEINNKGEANKKTISEAEMSRKLSKLRSDCEKKVRLVQNRNEELLSKTTELQEQVHRLEEEKIEKEARLKQLQVNTRYINDLEKEKTQLLRNLTSLKENLSESENRHVQAEKRCDTLRRTSEEEEKERLTRLQEALTFAATSAVTVKQLERAIQRLEMENEQLTEANQQQNLEIKTLKADLQSRNESLEAEQKQSKTSLAAQYEGLWEQELKNSAMLKLRVSELEKEKEELASQTANTEKMVAPKTAEDRLEEEITKSSELQAEVTRLRTLVKLAKKKLRERGMGEESLSTMDNEKMNREILRQRQLEKENMELQESLKQSHQDKRKMEMELQEVKTQLETTQKNCSEVEEKVKQELATKIQQVNQFLETQAKSQEAQNQMKDYNHASLRSQMEQRIKGLESQLSQIHFNQQNSRTELEKYKNMYSEERDLRQALAKQLRRANEQRYRI
ncbi:hypothetical protein WMY93_014224 [Mugilogobius chulae]|uniref:CCDC144C-like coiled-coil domain-containing protein n=1 Tax=Mugilogobius chulae TaxID=88201 RepID=A0AAW0NY56_9GOBI